MKIKVKIKEKPKCYRYFIDNCGQGFTAPCCYKVDENGDREADYYTFVKCEGNVDNCPFIRRIMESGRNK